MLTLISMMTLVSVQSLFNSTYLTLSDLPKVDILKMQYKILTSSQFKEKKIKIIISYC